VLRAARQTTAGLLLVEHLKAKGYLPKESKSGAKKR
jgi:hypothetical protein